MYQHESRQVRSYARHKAAGAKLAEGVVPTIRRHHIVSRLRAAVVTDDHPAALVAREVVDDAALAGVTEAEVSYDSDLGLHDDLLAWYGWEEKDPVRHRRTGSMSVSEPAGTTGVRVARAGQGVGR
jgi:hypothetical protein